MLSRNAEDHLLDLLLPAVVVGAACGGFFTGLTLVPSAMLASTLPGALPLAFVGLVSASCTLLLLGLAYLSRRGEAGRLDAATGRALPLVFFFLGSLVAPWARLAVVFPRFVEGAYLASLAVGLILLISAGWAFAGANRLTRLFAMLDLWIYGALATGLALSDRPVVWIGLSTAGLIYLWLLEVQGRGTFGRGFLGFGRRIPLGVVVLVGALALACGGRATLTLARHADDERAVLAPWGLDGREAHRVIAIGRRPGAP